MLETAADLGDWRAEYRAFTESCALAARPDRGTVLVAGPRCAEMIDGLLTNSVKDLAGAGRHALLLTAKGKVLTDLRVFPRGDDMLLDLPRAGLANLLGAFKKYLPPMHATFEDTSGSLSQLGLYGPQAAEAAAAGLGTEVPQVHLGVAEFEHTGARVTVIRSRRLAGDGVEIIAPGAAVPELAGRLLAAAEQRGGRASGMRALDIVRVESGVPRYGVDMDESNLAQETGLEEEAISYDKGCYLGQEVVARIHFRGHVNRRLAGLRFREEAASAGAALHDGEREVGTVTSAVESPEFGPIGLGYVRREIETSSVLRVSGGEVTVAEVPFRPYSV